MNSTRGAKSRRDFLRGVAAAVGTSATFAMFPPTLRKALGIPAYRRTGTIDDVGHIVVLMQENRSFDHYFGTLRGVRGFADRFPIPLPDAPQRLRKNVWLQEHRRSDGAPEVLAPFALNTRAAFAHMRVLGTPHEFVDAQRAWADGKLHEWPVHKHAHSLGYYTADDLPFQFAMAEAFTLCDAYHCAMHGGTNPNRLFLWTGTNDPLQTGGGPAIDNSYDTVQHDSDGGYTWVTYCERLQTAGISWQVYQDMSDNFTDNPLAGFRSFRAAHRGEAFANAPLAAHGLSTRDLDLLRADVLAGSLPQVSFVVATAEGSEHPGPSSPAQGADYTARVLEALTADPEVFARTVLLVMFDENDGFFDHLPPPAAPSRIVAPDGRVTTAGASTVDTRGEYHETPGPTATAEQQALRHRPYGPGPRVPMYVISPWSKGGWVNSETFDHTSVIRFIERRFGVYEPNISAYRRAMCGDLTSAFDFEAPDDGEVLSVFPPTFDLAQRARTLPAATTPPMPSHIALPAQAHGTRPSRALPYALTAAARVEPARRTVRLEFVNNGRAGAVFHVYDRRALTRVPRRYAVEAQKELADAFVLAEGDARYDLWVLGPNGFHRHFVGDLTALGGDRHGCLPEVQASYEAREGSVTLRLSNAGRAPCTFAIASEAYAYAPVRVQVAGHAEARHTFSLDDSGHWYDFSLRVPECAGFFRRLAGRVETGRHGISDPAMGGEALADQAFRAD